MESIQFLLIALVVAAYMGLLALLSVGRSRWSDRSGFFVADHNLTWWQMGTSLFATMYSSYNVVAIVTFAALFGLYAIIVIAGAFLGFALLYAVLGRNLTSADVRQWTSLEHYVERRVGKTAAKGAAVVVLLLLVAFITFQMYVNGSVLSAFLPVSPTTAMVASSVIVALYTLFGGLRASALTDIAQAGFMGLVMLAAIFIVLGGKNAVAWDAVFSLPPAHLLLGIAAMFVAQLWTIIVQPEVWQRILASRTQKDAASGLVFGSVLAFIFVLPLVLVGVMAGALANTGLPQGAEFITLAQQYVPQWFLPLLAVGIIAAFMSTLDSSLAAFGAYFAKWIGAPHSLSVARWAIVGVLALAGTFTFFLQSLLSAVLQIVAIAAIPGALLMGEYIVRRLRPDTPVSETAFTVGLGVGVAVFFLGSYAGWFGQDPMWSLVPPVAAVLVFAAGELLSRLKAREQGAEAGSGNVAV
ncbi:MAG: sodium:proline symporter [Candidatus Parcubacteria bacterium]|nr:MAG: sodium:proline symporter [Candidatus Parcubacteria bacterium]